MRKQLSRQFILAILVSAFLLPVGAAEFVGAVESVNFGESVNAAQACPSGTFPCSCNGTFLGCTDSISMCFLACMASPEQDLAASLTGEWFGWMVEPQSQTCAKTNNF